MISNQLQLQDNESSLNPRGRGKTSDVEFRAELVKKLLLAKITDVNQIHEEVEKVVGPISKRTIYSDVNRAKSLLRKDIGIRIENPVLDHLRIYNEMIERHLNAGDDKQARETMKEVHNMLGIRQYHGQTVIQNNLFQQNTTQGKSSAQEASVDLSKLDDTTLKALLQNVSSAPQNAESTDFDDAEIID